MKIEEAIKHAEEVAEEHIKYNRYGGFESWDECAEEHIQLADWLKELKQLREQTRWIPVSEKLPEKNVEVLATTEWGAVTIAEMYSANDWFIHEGTTNAGADEIVAWMPLPEPYKEESEGIGFWDKEYKEPESEEKE